MVEPELPVTLSNPQNARPRRKRIAIYFQRCLSVLQVIFGIASTVLGILILVFQGRNIAISCHRIGSTFDLVDLSLVIWAGFWVFVTGILGMYNSFLSILSQKVVIRDLVFNTVAGVLSVTRSVIGIPIFFVFNVQSDLCPLEIAMSTCGVASVFLCFPGILFNCCLLNEDKDNIVYEEPERVIECLSATQTEYNNPTYVTEETLSVTHSTRI